jgi:hypothetical protein
LLASAKSRNGKRVRLRVKATGRKRIARFVVQYRRTGKGTKKAYKKFRPRLKRSAKRIVFKKGRLGRTYLFRIRAIGKSGVRTDWQHRRLVFPYDESGKGRRYSAGWTHVRNRRAWRRGYMQSSQRGATLRFKTKGGGRIYLVARTGPNGGRAVVRARGGERRVVSFKTRKTRNRRVVAVVNRTDKRAVRFRLRVLGGTVAVDGIGIRRR